jgi:hypothetical protein
LCFNFTKKFDTRSIPGNSIYPLPDLIFKDDLQLVHHGIANFTKISN